MEMLKGSECVLNRESSEDPPEPVHRPPMVSGFRIQHITLVAVLGGLCAGSCSDDASSDRVSGGPAPAEEVGTEDGNTIEPAASTGTTSLFSCNNQPFECCVKEAYDCMIAVPAGTFVQGSKTGEGNPEETPRRLVTLSAYYTEKYEVTNANFKGCVAAGACTAPLIEKSNTRDSYYGNSAYDDFPMIYVTRDHAAAYCTWKSRRLPTEAEWEKAARGPADGSLVGLAGGQCSVADSAGTGNVANCNLRPYPWGGAMSTSAPFASGADCTKLNFHDGKDYCVGDTSLVGSYPAGASPYGILDMAGNVFEWVSDRYDSAYYGSAPATDPTGPATGAFGVYKGGAWDTGSDYARSSDRVDKSPAGMFRNLGFRCARTP